jgi:hypothetical protein
MRGGKMSDQNKRGDLYDSLYLVAIIILLIGSAILAFRMPNELGKFLPIGVPVLLLLTHVQKFQLTPIQLSCLKTISLAWSILLFIYMGVCLFWYL